MKKLLILLSIILAVSFIQAQDKPFYLTVTPSFVEYNYVSYNDLNWNTPEDQITLFALNVIPDPNYQGELPEIRFSIEWNGIKVHDVYEIQSLTGISSSDFFNSDYSNLDPLIDKLKEMVIDNGKLPDGNYILDFVIVESETGNSDDYQDHALSNTATFTLIIKSPNPITLITPGSPIGSSPIAINDANPYFVWVSNVDNYKFRIWEENSSTTTEDQLETIAPYYKDDISTTNFEYPTSAPALKYGKTYAWQITSEVHTSLGNDEINLKSRIYHFKLSNTETEAHSFNILEQYIRDFNPIGGEEFLKLLKEGYTVEQTSVDKIIDKLSKGKKIAEITVE